MSAVQDIDTDDFEIKTRLCVRLNIPHYLFNFKIANGEIEYHVVDGKVKYSVPDTLTAFASLFAEREQRRFNREQRHIDWQRRNEKERTCSAPEKATIDLFA